MRKLLFLFLLFAHLYAEQPISSGNIRILLAKDMEEILLEVKGPYTVFNPEDGSRLTSGLVGKRFLAHATAKGLRWGNDFIDIYQIRLEPRSAESTILVDGIQYSGGIVIYAVQGKLHVVNELPIENYIYSLLSTQFTDLSENEVISALAIVARTDAYYSILKDPGAFWHVDAKEVGYQGSALNRPNSLIQKNLEQTKHLILTHTTEGTKSPFPAKWTLHSGGKTAQYTAIFRHDASFSNVSVLAPHAALDRTGSKWQYTISKELLGQKFQLQGIQSIQPYVDKESNKIYALRLNYANGNKDLPFFDFQKKLGSSHVLSNDFTIEEKGGKFTFVGYGIGHGVGLCLYSATAMAQNGENALKILTKFFPGSSLYRLTSSEKEEIVQNVR